MIQHWDAWCNLIGSLLGLLGGFFLAYDIIGGKHGPLSGMTRSVSYIVIFFIGYTVTLGLRFGLIACLGMGIILGMEMYLAARRPRRLRNKPQARSLVIGLSVGRSFFVSLAFGAITNWKVALLLFPVQSVGISLLNLLGFAPADIRLNARLWDQLRNVAWGSLLRALASWLACWLAETMVGENFTAIGPPWKFGLAIGGTSLLVGFISPWVEDWVERMSQRWLAAIGVLMVVLGFLLQALPNWVVLLG
jgi:hypothetical protein